MRVIAPTNEQAKTALKAYDQLVDELEQAILNLNQDDRWTGFLKTLARQYPYSAGNILMAWLQCPELSYLASRGRWIADFGRHPSKGSSAIWIYAPLPRKVTELDPHTGEEHTYTQVTAFKLVPVFDLSQTTIFDEQKAAGAVFELPATLTWGTLQHEDPVFYEAVFRAIQGLDGIDIEEQEMPDDFGGFYVPQTGEIKLNSRHSSGRKAATLIHEVAHHLCHSEGETHHLEYRKTRAQAEVIAESVAYIVMTHFGLPADSHLYIAKWQHRKELEPGFLHDVLPQLRGKVELLINMLNRELEGTCLTNTLEA